jgi:hypothetical protein
VWRADTAIDSLAMMMDARPGKDSAYPNQFVAVGNRIAFVGDDANGQARLWLIDRDTRNTEGPSEPKLTPNDRETSPRHSGTSAR